MLDFSKGIPEHKTVVMVHALATSPQWGKNKPATQMVKEVRGWHVNERGWSDIAYAAIIDYDGNIAPGRDLDNDGDVFDETGAGAKGHNKNVIHIALAGGHGGSANDAPEDHFTRAQLYALRKLIERIGDTAGRYMWVRGHNEVAAKACPCFQVAPWWQAKAPRKLYQSTSLQASGVALTGWGASVMGSWQQLETWEKLVAMAVGLAIAWVIRERIKMWLVKGVR